MNRCRRWWNGFGRVPSSCAASDWPRPWDCGCRITRGTTGRCCRAQKKLLGSISAATLDRLLARSKARVSGGLSGTRPGTLLRRQVPIQGEVWDEQRLGFLEADSVAHCGSSLAGSFIWSLTYTDLASTWTEGRAVWNKGAHGVLEQTQER